MARHPLALLPAVRIVDGVALLAPSGYGTSSSTGTPAHAITSWLAQGATWIHVLDVDAQSRGAHDLGHIVTSGAHLQYQGGVRDEATLAAALATGAARIVVDPTDLEWATTALAAHPDRLAAGLDVSQPDIVALAMLLERAGCRRLVVSTDADGRWRHDRHLLQEICEATDVPVVALGGVEHLSDLHELHELVGSGLDGIVIDEGLYEGDFTFSEAVAASADRFDLFSWGPPGE